MGTLSDIGGKPRSDIVCLEGNGARESHHGCGWSTGAMFTLNSTEVHAVAYIYDARGNGGGGTSPTITGDHQNRITDYTAIVLEVYETADSTGIKSKPRNDNG